MLIRSQDNLVIVNLNNIKSIRIEQPLAPGPWYFCVDGIRIGSYSSKSKALSVLDRIENTWRQYGFEQKSIHLPDDDSIDE